MKQYDITNTLLADTAADSVVNRGAEQAALESHLQALKDSYHELRHIGGSSKDIADIKLQMARALVGLERGSDAVETRKMVLLK